jgi:hypothetical protein
VPLRAAIGPLVAAMVALTAAELWQSAGGWGLSYAMAAAARHLPGYGIIAFHADDLTVDNLVVRDNGGNGIASIFTHRFTIANVVASNNAGFGVDAGNTDRMAVTGVIARDNGCYGIGRRLCCSRLVSSTTDPRLDLVRVKQRRMNGVGVGRSLFRCRAVGSGFSLLGRP